MGNVVAATGGAVLVLAILAGICADFSANRVLG